MDTRSPNASPQNADRIYRDQSGPIQPFVFDEKVSSVFDDMASRSIPNYRETLRLSAALVGERIDDDSLIYDLGSSTGALASLLLPGLLGTRARYVGVDSSEAMVREARGRFAEERRADVSFQLGDVSEQRFERCSAVVANYCLQFTPVQTRDETIRRIFEALDDRNGLFVFSEKILGSSATEDALLVRQYEAFKRQMGYTNQEIAAKKQALNGVLRPLSVEANLSMLYAAGFEVISAPLRWMNFVTFVAWKRAPEIASRGFRASEA